jgi:hypothetical protein
MPGRDELIEGTSSLKLLEFGGEVKSDFLNWVGFGAEGVDVVWMCDGYVNAE